MTAPTLKEIPDHFYKYRSLATPDQHERLRQILTRNELHWSSPLDFNDPFDCAPVHKIGVSRLKRDLEVARIARTTLGDLPRGERRKRVKQAVAKPDHEVERAMDLAQMGTVAGYAVCSLSAVPDSILMWSHYSDCHRGVCLRFTPAAKSARKTMLTTDLHFEFALPVFYSADRPIIDPLVRDPDENLKKAVLTKAREWEYEREWRIIETNGPGRRPFPPHCLDAVILGARMNAADQAQIIEWVRSRTAPTAILQASFDPEHFAINIAPSMV